MANKECNFDLVIVGAGPAGLSAAVWSADLGLKSIVLEKEGEYGGQLLHIYNHINNYVGCAAVDGRELRDRFLETLRKSKAAFENGITVAEIDTESLSVENSDRIRYFGKNIVFATGVRRRRLNIPGESDFIGKGILVSGAKERSEVAEKTVAIIGGGDAALENSLILAETAKRVYVIHRRADLRARSEFIERAADNPRIEFILNTEVRAINGDQVLESIELKDQGTNSLASLPIDRLLVRIGVIPNSELLKGKCRLDTDGYVIADKLGRTNIPGLYAIGDVANPVSPTIATSVGSAASAIKHIASLRH